MNKTEDNIILLTDSYKVGHYNMYPAGTKKVYSYFESRKGAKFDKTLFFGLQYLLIKYLVGQVVTKEKIALAEKIVNAHLGPDVFNKEGWEYILEKHDGKLPLIIKAVPEGRVIPVNNVLMTVENTDPNCAWLTNYLETLLSHVWASSTVATLSYECKDMLKNYLDKTSDNMEGLAFQLHDFGFRGVSSVESASICGAGHLINFSGTDTIAAITCAMDYYDSDVCAWSVFATEHSIMTSYGEDGEKKLLGELLNNYPKGILSIVIDSYNHLRFIKEYAAEYKDIIMNKEGVTVFRPDSGPPVSTTLEIMNALADVFGFTENSKGFKVLPPQVKMLWGDGIDYYGIKSILEALKDDGWSTENIVFGMGGGLLQKVNRDTQRFAFKCSAQYRGETWYDISKIPLDCTKRSMHGKLKLINLSDGEYVTVNPKCYPDHEDTLVTVFENGELLNKITFAEVRENSNK